MREKSEMKSHLAANMCKLEHSVPSRSEEEHSAQEEAIQEAIQVAAARLQAPQHHSRQEEQEIQVVLRSMGSIGQI